MRACSAKFCPTSGGGGGGGATDADADTEATTDADVDAEADGATAADADDEVDVDAATDGAPAVVETFFEGGGSGLPAQPTTIAAATSMHRVRTFGAWSNEDASEPGRMGKAAILSQLCRAV